MKQKRDYTRIPLKVIVWCIGGWTQSGLVHSYYKRDLYGDYERISEHHYYDMSSGRDIYPDREQLKRLLAGEEVLLQVDQWA